MSRWFMLVMATVLMGSCAAGPRGGVRPAPPGPIDLFRMLAGDYSGLCPKDYEFCKGGRRSICCPFFRGCCEDASGPYCCAGAPPGYGESYRSGEDYDEQNLAGYSCPSRDLTCAQGGRTVCCSRSDGCCVDDTGPYCCSRTGGGGTREYRYEERDYRD